MWLGLKKYILLVLFSALLVVGSAQQNLVPNWSFENITQCPSYLINSTLPFAPPWQNPTAGTPDIFSPCDSVVITGHPCPINGVPCNGAGIQTPITGTNYAGIFLYGLNIAGANGNAREYIQVKLTDSLKANKPYCVSFYTSPGERSMYVTSRVGLYLSTTAISSTTWTALPVSPQIEPPFHSYISDTINWTEIKGLYMANGGENYITLGNFYDNPFTDTLYRGGNKNSDMYYYFENISVVQYMSAFVGIDTTICSGIKINRQLNSAFGAQYNWAILSGDMNSIDSSQVASPSFSPSVTSVYVLEKKQCGISSFDTLIIQVPLKFPAIASHDTTICVGDTVSLTANNNCIWCTHSWNTGNSALQISVSPVTSTIYSFTQTDSCFTTKDYVNVSTEYCNSPVVSPPNIFTPNEDEINDTWLPSIKNEISLKDYSLEIFNRWGIQIFKTKNTKDSWDGRTTSGIECAEGTYYFVIKFFDEKEKQIKSTKGFIQLIR